MTLRLAEDREVRTAQDGHTEAIVAAFEFRVDVMRERDAVRVCPVGELDMATIARVRDHLEEAMAAAAGRVILDLRGTTFLDSSALHLAVEVYERSARDGTGFAIIAGPPTVQRAFEIAGLSERLPFVDVPRG
jgi:anti-anti-sigma factor